MLSPSVTIDDQGRIVAIGIIPERRTSEAQLEAGWAHLFNLPRIWSLCDDGGTLCQAPAPELAKLRGPHVRYENVKVAPGGSGHLQDVRGMQLEIVAEFKPGDARQFGLDVRRSPSGEEVTRIYYDADAQTINLDLRQSTLSPTVFEDVKVLRQADFPLAAGESLKLHIFIDHSVVEVFVNDRAAFATRIYPSLEVSTGIDLFAGGGTATAHSIDVWKLSTVQHRSD